MPINAKDSTSHGSRGHNLANLGLTLQDVERRPNDLRSCGSVFFSKELWREVLSYPFLYQNQISFSVIALAIQANPC
jgi:hypothetical protein